MRRFRNGNAIFPACFCMGVEYREDGAENQTLQTGGEIAWKETRVVFGGDKHDIPAVHCLRVCEAKMDREVTANVNYPVLTGLSHADKPLLFPHDKADQIHQENEGTGKHE